MALRISLSTWSAAFYATLGLGTMAACGGATSGGAGNENLRSTDAGDGAATGGTPSTGGAGTGGVGAGGSGGFTEIAGSGGVVATGGYIGDGVVLGTGGYVGGAGGVGTGGSAQGLPCLNPQPIVGPNGELSGYVQCDGAWIHREAQMTCPTWLPRPDTFPAYDGGSNCTSDADCTARPNGYCGSPQGDLYYGYQCTYGCRTDAECGAGSICVCGNPVGHCEQTTCANDADCAPGFLCAQYQDQPYCGPYAFACQSPFDQCMSANDCGGSTCVYENGVRHCSNATCVIGRPFLVCGEERSAPVIMRAGWDAETSLSLDDLDAHAKKRLAAYWARIASLEHASIAAFARFSLELLALGAPPELVEAAQAAMSDETRHAKLAFGLASAFGETNFGPGMLDIRGAVDSASLMHVVRTAVLEGCIGETIAAIEAAEALERAADPAVEAVLRQIARDETKHAALAYRFVQWVLSTAGEALRDDIVGEIVANVELEIEAARGALERSDDAKEDDTSDRLVSYGLLPKTVSREIRSSALTGVVRPCVAALVDSVRRDPRRDVKGVEVVA